MKKYALMRFYFLLLFIISFPVFAQSPEFVISAIPDALKQNANAVVRLNRIEIKISSRKLFTIKKFRAVSVLNELGIANINANEYYAVKSISAVIYDADGKKIKKLERKDFKEHSVAEGFEIIDSKIIALDYIPTQYPFTIVFESVVDDANTAFLPSWYPLDEPFVSVENSSISIASEAGAVICKESNFGQYDIVKNQSENRISFTAKNLPAVKSEQYSPAFQKYVPNVLFSLKNFHLEGVDGEASTWEKMGSWIYSSLLAGSDELPIDVQEKIKRLVGTETDPIKKAEIIYNYVQQRTRYVSIQLGIGGWKPMQAKDVERLGYGDCKALTNYTRALLQVVGVPSYYAIVYSDKNKRDLQSDFVSIQGNHVILAIPHQHKLLWLECTSQTTPFNFLGQSTNDRTALLIKPTGGELVRTSVSAPKDNTQVTVGNYIVDSAGHLTGKLQIHSRGLQYDQKASLESKSEKDLQKHYENYFDLENIVINSPKMINNKAGTEFTEKLNIEAAMYASTTNDRIVFPLNAFNQSQNVPQRYRTRMNPFELSFGFQDSDEITIDIPAGFRIEAKPEQFEIKDKFGEYKAEVTVINERQLLYKRSFLLNEGMFDRSDYENFRKFREQVAKMDNSKMVLVKI